MQNTLFLFIVIHKKCIKKMFSHLELAGILEHLIIYVEYLII